MNADTKLRFDGKRVLVVGGATGIGAAGAQLALALGGEVIVMDYAPIALEGVQRIKVNLAQRESIDAAIAELQAPLNVVFMCAGVAEGAPHIECINFVGHRYLLEKLMAEDRLRRGGAVCFISSSAGLGWEANFAELSELLNIQDFSAAADWMRTHGKANYMGTKQAVCAYVAGEALAFLKRGIRVNAICPGPTDTPLAQANQWLGGGSDFRDAAGIKPSDPMEQAYPIAFLCSDAASAITGVTLVSDQGWFNAGLVHSFPPATRIAEFLMGRKLSFT
jgi:NAD(P)-dependent dehydrogenase (short-subunit alcohol dehydrogenase family)